MTEEAWNAGWVRSLAVLFNGQTLNLIDDFGRPVTDDTFVLVLNSHHESVHYTLPPSPKGGCWELVLDTAGQNNPSHSGKPGQEIDLQGRSVLVLRESAP